MNAMRQKEIHSIHIYGNDISTQITKVNISRVNILRVFHLHYSCLTERTSYWSVTSKAFTTKLASPLVITVSLETLMVDNP